MFQNMCCRTIRIFFVSINLVVVVVVAQFVEFSVNRCMILCGCLVWALPNPQPILIIASDWEIVASGVLNSESCKIVIVSLIIEVS